MSRLSDIVANGNNVKPPKSVEYDHILVPQMMLHAGKPAPVDLAKYVADRAAEGWRLLSHCGAMIPAQSRAVATVEGGQEIPQGTMMQPGWSLIFVRK